MIYTVKRPVLHPLLNRMCAEGEDIELSFSHAQNLLESGTISIPVIVTKEQKSIYEKRRKNN